jgi:hypothetical protein
VLRILFSVLFIFPALAQNTMDCKCRQVEGQEYMCKCMAAGTGTMPASLDFKAPVGKSSSAASVLSTPTKTEGAKPAVASNAVASDTAKPGTAAEGKETGKTTASGQRIYEGPRGGQYHYSASGKKVYERKKQ